MSRNSRRKHSNQQVLPAIPDKRYFTIGEVSFLCCVKPHVLRYWEEEFPQLSPIKRRGNRRYYQHKDVLLVRQIRQLLYENGFTIQGARSQLASGTVEQTKLVESSHVEQTDSILRKMITDLEEVLEQLKLGIVDN